MRARAARNATSPAVQATVLFVVTVFDNVTLPLIVNGDATLVDVQAARPPLSGSPPSAGGMACRSPGAPTPAARTGDRAA